jgi:nucleoside-diphosphate-sugar epimerase
MKVFLAGATGAIGRPLTKLLIAAGHNVVGTTRSSAKADAIAAAGARAVVLDIFDAAAVNRAVAQARPEIVMHQLTDLPQTLDPAAMAPALERNARLRIEGTPILMAAAAAAGVRRVIAQSIAFSYAPGRTPLQEFDPLGTADGKPSVSLKGVIALEQAVMGAAGVEGVLLRYGRLYGPGTWNERPPEPPSVHVDAAAQAAVLALSGPPGIYNIADDDGVVSIVRARNFLGWSPRFRMS